MANHDSTGSKPAGRGSVTATYRRSFVSSNDKVTGTRIWNVEHKGYDPPSPWRIGGDSFHNDSIQVTGDVQDLSVSDSSLGQMADAYELLLFEEADAWFEYLEATRGQLEIRYKEIEPWAWARLHQRLRAIRTKKQKLKPAAAA